MGRIATRNGTAFKYSGLGQDVVSDGTSVFGRSLGGAPISSKSTAAGSLRWLVSDQHGDVVGTVNPVGGLMDSTVGFDPWGQVTGRTGTGTSQAGFQGDWTDPTSGVVDMEARGYSPGQGGFTSRDSYGGTTGNPLSQNRYAYGEGDPLNNSDPSGRSPSEGGVSGGTMPSSSEVASGRQLNDFYFKVDAAQRLDVFQNTPSPAAPNPGGDFGSYLFAVQQNLFYRAVAIDVLFRVASANNGGGAEYGDGSGAQRAIAADAAVYKQIAAFAWAMAHPEPVTPTVATVRPKSATAPRVQPPGRHQPRLSQPDDDCWLADGSEGCFVPPGLIAGGPVSGTGGGQTQPPALSGPELDVLDKVKKFGPDVLDNDGRKVWKAAKQKLKAIEKFAGTRNKKKRGTQNHKSTDGTDLLTWGAVGGALWWAGKLLSPACGPAAPACAVAL